MRKSVCWKKWMPAFLAFLLTISVFVSNLNNDCGWGDDFAAYINQGIALADGRLDEQVHLNPFLHPTALSKEIDDTLVYAMGYPFILSAVYRLVGFDREAYTNLHYYKLPSVLAMAGCSMILFFLFRRRFSTLISFIFAVLFCIHPTMLDLVDSLYSDSVFLFFVLLIINSTEAFLDAVEKGYDRKAILSGITLGFALAMACFIRFNGPIFCVAAGLTCLLWLRKKHTARRVAMLLLPWAVFGVLLAAVSAVFPKATMDSSNYSENIMASVMRNAGSCFKHTLSWFSFLFGSWPPRPLRYLIAMIGALLFVLGVHKAHRKELLLLILLIGTYAGSMLVPYTYSQKLRYYYPVLFIFLLFMGYGLSSLWSWIRVRFFTRRDILRRAAMFCLLALLAGATLGAYSGNYIRMISGKGVSAQKGPTPFCEESVDMYRFIRNNTPKNSVIAFYKPRLLYLATERLSFNVGVNGHDFSQADYYLQRTDIIRDSEVFGIKEFSGSLQELYVSGSLTLYSVTP